MRLNIQFLIKKRVLYFFAAAVLLTVFVGQNVFADSGPILMNVNPQGTVTSQSVKITLDTEDLARCRYSTTDTSYSSMSNDLETPDGLYHSVLLGTLPKGSYTYYVRCQDFRGDANNSSAVIRFTVGEVNCVGDNCPLNPPVIPPSDTIAPVLSKLMPSGTLYTSYVILSVTTNEPASCRYSWYDKSYEAMTLSFSSTNQLDHIVSATLANYGYYNYYVRCKDTAGNVNQVAGRISFTYASKTPIVTPPVTPKDTTPPEISGFLPSGEVTAETVTIACTTDENATCKYDTSDNSYDSMANVFDGAGSKNHSKQIVLSASGQYIYYVRCKDSLGNKNTNSSQISFDYVASIKEGPVIFDLQPTGAIYLNRVALIVTTDKPADCRYSKQDTDFDVMVDAFDTSDGQLHQATVELDNYGSYAYYVRCRDKEGNKNSRSEVINFEYKSSEPELEETETPAGESKPISCDQITIGDKDGVCDKTIDCLCDPDCPTRGDDADPDCANVSTKSQGSGWVVVLFIGLILLVIIIVILILIRRNKQNEEEVELP